MPTKHIVKSFSSPAFYHVYNRASGERLLFKDTSDRSFFISLLQKHLAENNDPEKLVKTYHISIAAYCLMGNHFHLLLYQGHETDAISNYMRSVGTTYSMYYNRKYRSKGHVFQSSFRASHVDNEAYLAHISRYIHLNPRRYKTWRWSSYKEYIGEVQSGWVHPELTLEAQHLGEWYREFVDSYAATDRRTQHSELVDILSD